MKVLVLLSLVAFCTAVPTLLGRRLTVLEDGTVTLVGSKGHELDILRSIVNPRALTVVVKTPYGLHRTFQINEIDNIKDLNLRKIVGTKYTKYEEFNQADVLIDIFRQYQGIVDDKTFVTLLSKIQVLVQAGVLDQTFLDILKNWDLDRRMHEVSNIVPVEGVNALYNTQLDSENILPIHQYGYTGLQSKWNLNNELGYLSPVERFQTLLQQIKEHSQFQQGLLGQQQTLNQYWTPELSHYFNQEMTHEQLLKNIYQQQIGQTELAPLNRYLVNMKVINGQEQYLVPQQFFNIELLQQWFVQQQLVNERINHLIETRAPASEELIYKQRLLNQQAEQFIQQLVYHQNIVIRQVEQLIEQGQAVPQTLVYQQRLVFEQVHHLIEKLVLQQIFIHHKIQQVIELGLSVHQELFVQQRIIYQQVQKLIQQLFVQQTEIKQQIQILIQKGQVVPQELVVFQKLTYQHVEQFIQVLIKQFVYQQTYFKQLIQYFVQQKQVVPQELVHQYITIYTELVQLIKLGDFVPQELIYQQNLVHQQIVLLLRKEQVVPVEYLNQWYPQEQLNLWQGQDVYQRVPYYNQWVPQANQWNLLQEQNVYHRLPTVY